MVEKAFAYIEKNQARFVQELQEFLRFPSVSTQPARRGDLLKCARWLADHLAKIGLESRLIEDHGHPIVWAKAPAKTSRRVIIYGHYDVQPEDPIDQWKSPPFTPTIRDGFIYARGATDDKGQLFAHIKAVESLIRTAGELPSEVMFIIEGEEESGGEALEKYVKHRKAELAADAIVISDTGMHDENTPAVTYGLRGIVSFDVTVRVADHDLHSGSFGGLVANPATVLSQIISRCVATDGKVQIPGFYDRVRPLADWEKQNIEKLAYDENKLLKQIGAKQTLGEPGFTALERNWARPTFDVNGVFGGYAGPGMKTIIPASATAKISIRLVPDQNPDRIFETVAAHMKSLCPPYAWIEIDGPVAAAPPVVFGVDSPIIKTGVQALRCGFGAEPVLIRCGGSIPVVSTFWQELEKPILLIGFGLESDRAHSPNERFKIANFTKGTKTSAYLIANI